MARHLGSFALLNNTAVTGPDVTVPGGRFIWTVNAGAWNGATATLQTVGADGATRMPVATLTADGAVDVICGQNATLRVAVTGGPPTAMYSSVGGVM